MKRYDAPTEVVMVRRRHPFVKLAAGLTVVVGALAVGALLMASISLPNPFGTTTKEKPDSVVLAQMQDLARFDAANGRFQTIVDQEQDANLLPDWVKGQHTVLSAEGDVTASVDFSGLGPDAVELSTDGTRATVHLPAPVLSAPQLDPSTTRVISRDRGVLDRIDDALTSGNPTDDSPLYQRATDKLADAAAQSDLDARARTNATKTVEALLHAAGVEQVTVVFDGGTAGQRAV